MNRMVLIKIMDANTNKLIYEVYVGEQNFNTGMNSVGASLNYFLKSDREDLAEGKEGKQ